MRFSITATITPKFDSKIIYREWIERDWIEFQDSAYSLGEKMLSFMHQVIANKSKSDKDKLTGDLVRSIKLYGTAGAGQSEIWWGIGKIAELEKYWGIINFGGSGWNGMYHIVPGEFENGKFNYDPTSKKGKRLPSGVKGIIAPMNYVGETTLQLDSELMNILKTIKGK